MADPTPLATGRDHPLVAALGGLGGPPARPGVVHLVGGGPGDPGYLTARACVLLATCDVVLHDRLSPPEALELVPADADRILVGKRYGEDGMTRGEVDALMATLAADGKAVVRLKGGDPLVFGRGSEEATALAVAGIPFELVSGVTSAIAVPAAAGIPVTHRGVAAGFAVITGHEDPAKGGGHIDFATLAKFSGTLLFLMGVGHIGEIASQLRQHGRADDEPVALVRWGTTPRQQVLRATLATVAAEVERTGFRSPAVTVVGPVAAMGEPLSWRHDLPLFSRSVLIPRSRDQASSLAMRVRALGGEAIEAPTIEIRAAEPGPLVAAARSLVAGHHVGMALTSPNAVDAIADALEAIGGDARALAGLTHLGCVGSGTSQRLWERLRVRPDLVPADATGAALAQLWPEGAGSVLLPRGDLATDELPDVLRSKGWSPSPVVAYVTAPLDDLPEGVLERLAAGTIDLLAFTSSSTVRNFVAIMDKQPWSARVVSIGPVTSATCRELGLDVHTEAEVHDLDGLCAALVASATAVEPREAS